MLQRWKLQWKHDRAGCLLEGCSILVIVAILIAAIVPAFNTVSPRSNMVDARGRCLQIVTALRNYSKEHDGSYPDVLLPGSSTANEAFRELFIDDYIDSEKPFTVKTSPFTANGYLGEPPNYSRALEPGENHWAMTKGVTTTSDPKMPLVFENPAEASWPPKWNVENAGKPVPGRAWPRRRIVVGFNDSSVQTIELDPDQYPLAGPKNDGNGKNVFTRAAEKMEILNVEQ